MDTKPLEHEAESTVRNKLLQWEFKVTKPDFDTQGTDLLILNEAKGNECKIIQKAKRGRCLILNLLNRTRDSIPRSNPFVSSHGYNYGITLAASFAFLASTIFIGSLGSTLQSTYRARSRRAITWKSCSAR